MQFTFRFKGHPPSVNKAFATDWRRKTRFKSKDYAAWSRYVTNELHILRVERPTPGFPIHCEIEIHSARWMTGKGTVRKVDLANFEKCLIDPVFEFLGLEDSYIFELKMTKVTSDEEFTVLKIFDATEH